MREPALGLKTSLLNGGSFLKRIHENLRSVWRLPWAPIPSAGAPIHLLDERRAWTAPAAHVGSVLVHGVLFALILALTLWAPKRREIDPFTVLPGRSIEYWSDHASHANGPDGGGKAGGGGNHNPLPPPAGELAPHSRIQLAPPRLPDGRIHPLPDPATILDAEAPVVVAPVNELGLPWMKDKTDSAGPGTSGVGNTSGTSMGRNGLDGDGESDSSLAYNRVASQVICRVCPDPLYSEEARKTKLQGSVLLAVLVGADGRVNEVRVLRGLGMGLDENAVQAVRGWQFLPAKDAAQHPVASWIRVETMFRLF
ncbi:MAG TPA: TonB family protein [Candidatus Acidoferrum sp.]|nr:TonB family protein [Candidatus Acidoferrum sp.]